MSNPEHFAIFSGIAILYEINLYKERRSQDKGEPDE
jgi:hypothetical protein